MRNLFLIIIILILFGCTSFKGVIKEKGIPDEILYELNDGWTDVYLVYNDEGYYNFFYNFSSLGKYDPALNGIEFEEKKFQDYIRTFDYLYSGIKLYSYNNGYFTAPSLWRMYTANIHSRIIKNVPQLIGKNPAYDYIITQNDLDKVISVAGFPLKLEVFKKVENVGMHLRLFYKDAFYEFITGPECEYSKLDFAFQFSGDSSFQAFQQLKEKANSFRENIVLGNIDFYKKPFKGEMPDWFSFRFRKYSHVPTSNNSYFVVQKLHK